MAVSTLTRLRSGLRALVHARTTSGVPVMKEASLVSIDRDGIRLRLPAGFHAGAIRTGAVRLATAEAAIDLPFDLAWTRREAGCTVLGIRFTRPHPEAARLANSPLHVWI